MEDTPSYILPSESEKLSHKFILDAIRRRKQATHEEAPPSVELANDDVPIAVTDSTEAENAEPVIDPIPDVDSAEVSTVEIDTFTDEPLLLESETPVGQSLEFQALALPPDKAYFRIGEVASLLGVEPHVLRYWESEFPIIRPSKSGGQRVYRRKDVENLHLIRHLLHVEKFSIKGARRKLLERKRAMPQVAPDPETSAAKELLKDLQQELRELIRLAQGNPGI